MTRPFPLLCPFSLSLAFPFLTGRGSLARCSVGDYSAFWRNGVAAISSRVLCEEKGTLIEGLILGWVNPLTLSGLGMAETERR